MSAISGDLYIFNSAINREGITTNTGIVDIASATQTELSKAGILGYWAAAYDPNGVVNNSVDPSAVAISLNSAQAYLAPLAGHELEGTSLYINGVSMPLTLVDGKIIPIPSSITPYAAGNSLLNFNAGIYRIQEISIWSMTRQPYQVIDDISAAWSPATSPSSSSICPAPSWLRLWTVPSCP